MCHVAAQAAIEVNGVASADESFVRPPPNLEAEPLCGAVIDWYGLT